MIYFFGLIASRPACVEQNLADDAPCVRCPAAMAALMAFLQALAEYFPLFSSIYFLIAAREAPRPKLWFLAQAATHIVA